MAIITLLLRILFPRFFTGTLPENKVIPLLLTGCSLISLVPLLPYCYAGTIPTTYKLFPCCYTRYDLPWSAVFKLWGLLPAMVGVGVWNKVIRGFRWSWPVIIFSLLWILVDNLRTPGCICTAKCKYTLCLFKRWLLFYPICRLLQG